MRGHRSDIVLWVAGVGLGLFATYIAIGLGLPIRSKEGERPYVAGLGFVLLVALGIVAIASLVSAIAKGGPGGRYERIEVGSLDRSRRSDRWVLGHDVSPLRLQPHA